MLNIFKYNNPDKYILIRYQIISVSRLASLFLSGRVFCPSLHSEDTVRRALSSCILDEGCLLLVSAILLLLLFLLLSGDALIVTRVGSFHKFIVPLLVLVTLLKRLLSDGKIQTSLSLG